MCYSNNALCEYNVVAIIHFDCSSTTWNSLSNFIFLVSIQLCDGNNVRTWILAIKMETSCMYRVSLLRCNFHNSNAYFLLTRSILYNVHSQCTISIQYIPQEIESKQHLQFCDVCLGFKAPRSHHCRR